MKKGILLLGLFFCFQWVEAQQKNAKVIIEVNGVCNSCKTRIEKASLAVKGVKYAKWDVKTHQLSLIINEKKTNIEAVQQSVAKSGHDNYNPETQKEFIAREQDYEGVSACCKYRDEEVVKNHP